MITEQFLEEKEIISPKCFYGEREKLLDVCIITFSYIIFSSAKDMEGSKVIATVPSAGGNYEIIKLDVKEKRVGIFLSPVGAPAAGGLMEDINALTGAENFILFGSCGSLDEKKTKGKYIVVEEAYRDEGLSYHYIPPSDYVSVPTWREIRDFFEKKEYSLCGWKDLDDRCHVQGDEKGNGEKKGRRLYCRGNGNSRMPGCS